MSDILDEPIKEYQLNEFTDAAYAKCKTACLFFIIGVLLIVLVNTMGFIPEDNAYLLIGVFMLVSMIYGVLGFIQSLKSIRKKEEDGFKKWSSFVIGLGSVLFLFSFVITNIFDVFRTLGLG